MGNATVGISFISVYEDVLVNLYKKYLRLSANIFMRSIPSPEYGCR